MCLRVPVLLRVGRQKQTIHVENYTRSCEELKLQPLHFCRREEKKQESTAYFVLMCAMVGVWGFVMCVFVRVLKCVGVLVNVYCIVTEVLLNLTGVFVTLTEVFPRFFLSSKANARVKLAKTGHGPHSSTLVVICVVRLLFVLFYVVCKCVLPPGDNPIAVNKYINLMAIPILCCS
jgi:hypothetical protein